VQGTSAGEAFIVNNLNALVVAKRSIHVLRLGIKPIEWECALPLLWSLNMRRGMAFDWP
jgi:hypothetical protein